MNPNLVVIDQLGIGGTAIYGLKVAAIGMGIVFVGLILLIGLIKIFTWLLAPKSVLAQNKPSQGMPKPDQKTPIQGSGAKMDSLDPCILAAITAAVVSYMETAANSGVGMIHKAPAFQGKAWGQAGRNELMEGRNINKRGR